VKTSVHTHTAPKRERLFAQALSVALSLFILGSIASCSRSDQKVVLASIGDYEVTEKHFQNAFRNYYNQTGQAIPVNDLTKKAVLDSELDRYTIVTWAADRGWHNDEAGQRQKSLIERQVIMQEYERIFLHSGVDANESDLRELFVRYNARIRASHLYAPDRGTADSLYSRLQAGESFEDLAQSIFANQHLRDNAGDLGFFTVDEMDPAFENVAYRMQIGEISPPVRTNQGYSIIMVTDKVIKPIVTESEFANRRAALYEYALKRNREMATRRDLENVTARITINESLLPELLEQSKIDAEGNRFGISAGDDAIIAELDSYSLTLSQFRYEVSLLEISEIKDQHALRDIIEGITYRSVAIEKVRNHSSFDPTFADQVAEATFHAWLIERFNTFLDQEIIIPDTDLRSMYNSNEEFRMGPLMLNMAELVAGSKEDALEAQKELRSGANFKEVLISYGVMGESLLFDGEIGWRPVDSFGKFAPNLRDMQSEMISEPLEYTPDRWIVYKCLGRKEPGPISFEDARSMLTGMRKADEVKKLRNSIIDETKQLHSAEAHYDRMKTVSITI